MKISIGADHGAVPLRLHLIQVLREEGHDVLDHGTEDEQSVDYPDYAKAVAREVASGTSDFGVLCCTNGIGMSIAANKTPGVRAALIHFEDDAFYARSHNNANVICFGSRHHTHYDAARFLRRFLAIPFEGGRHARRVNKFESTREVSAS